MKWRMKWRNNGAFTQNRANMSTLPPLPATDDLSSLVDLIARHANGLGVDALQRLLPGAPPRRTLQRRLAELVTLGVLQRQGMARASRYVAVGPEAAVNLLRSRYRPALDADGQPGQGTQVLRQDLPPWPAAPEGASRPVDPTAGAQLPHPRRMPLDVPLSAEGREIQALVRRSLRERAPVGYQLSFLEDYHPNDSAYLSIALRGQLHALGRSPRGEAPAGTFARDILQRLLIDLSWASSHLEGNTYSQLDTERLIELGQAADGKDAAETQMILNHKDAIQFLVRDPEQARLSSPTLIALHALLSDGLMADPSACGRIRTRAVGIGGSTYLPLAVPPQLAELFEIVVGMAAEIVDPFEQAFFLMVHLPYLQPFEDVNKRVSRLAANIPFIRHNLCPLSFLDVAPEQYVDAMLGVYELNRVELLRDLFVAAYARSCQQYVAVQRSLVAPDLFRLRHRQVLGRVVASLVRQGQEPGPDTIRSALAQQVDAAIGPADEARFITLVRQEFETLHAGNVVRFGLRPLEWEAWRARCR